MATNHPAVEKARAPLVAGYAPPRATPSNYPEPFASRFHGRTKRPLGELFGLKNFGVNLTTLQPGAISALQHQHSKQDEFIYILDGELVLVSGTNEWIMRAGWCVGFPASGASHHLENRSSRPASYLEVGDRSAGDLVSYPADDLVAVLDQGQWRFTRKNGERY
jgi:uncharacterized cupin superfamily protein